MKVYEDIIDDNYILIVKNYNKNNINYSFLNDSISQEFPLFEYQGKTYEIESTNFECKEYIPTITS